MSDVIIIKVSVPYSSKPCSIKSGQQVLRMCIKQAFSSRSYIIIIIIEGLSLLQSIPPTTADKQTKVLYVLIYFTHIQYIITNKMPDTWSDP